MKSINKTPTTGFTRFELLVILFVTVGLTAIALPVLGATSARSRLAQCFNNLREIGRASQAWASEKNDFPWLIPRADGGLNNRDGQIPFAANPFIHFSFMSNELVSPRLLVCPSDTVKKVAKDFSSNLDGGFLGLAYQNNALSYLVGFHGSVTLPREILSGDRTMRTTVNEHCSVVGVPASALVPGDSSIMWTNLHSKTGHLLFSDTSVENLSSAQLRKTIADSSGNTAAPTHIQIPGLPASILE